MDALIEKLKSSEHGFKHIIETSDFILKDTSIGHLEFGTKLMDDGAYHIRMLTAYLFGQLSAKLKLLTITVNLLAMRNH